ncbi:TetR/AcrR family transcriptional regulator [Streptomyces chartreusis]
MIEGPQGRIDHGQRGGNQSGHEAPDGSQLTLSGCGATGCSDLGVWASYTVQERLGDTILDLKVKNGVIVLRMGRPKQFDPDIAVEHAVEVFWRKGYSATTPQDLVDALGIGKGSLYNTFGSKHALFERALNCYRASQGTALNEMLAEPGQVKERLRKTLKLLAAMDFADPDRRGCMAVNTAAELAGTDLVATELVRRHFAQTEGAFRELIEEGQRSGEIAPEHDAVAWGRVLLNTLVGLQLMVRVAESPDQLFQVIEETIDSL